MLSILTFNLQAAIPTGLSDTNTQQMPFFKTPNSPFTSGYISRELLLKHKVQSPTSTESYYSWNQQRYKLTELKPTFATHLSEFVIDKKNHLRWKVLDLTISTITAENLETHQTSKFDIQDLKSDLYDLGFLLVLKDSYLKMTPDDSAKVITTIPQGLRFKALKYKNGFAEIKYQNYTGYLSLSETITKFDLAKIVYADKKWQFANKRQFDYIITTENKKIHLSKIEGIVTPDNKGIIASNTQPIPMWSQVEVLAESKQTWAQSQIKGHGLVWWKLNRSENVDIYTIDDLLKKDVSSVSFHPKNPLKGLLSANGVYLTEDGFHWKKIPEFEKFNGPVHYFNDLLLFVGNHRSSDGGKTFENYIQIDKLTTAIAGQFGFIPKKLQVKKIETLAPFILRIEIQTSTKKIKMQSSLFTQNWQAVKY